MLLGKKIHRVARVDGTRRGRKNVTWHIVPAFLVGMWKGWQEGWKR